ncbi:MAG: aspartate kinase, partial [Deltaproteobacteria bacterium]|nr:aspartate kinase [Deltaproteobacteria bacterium]
MSQIVVQKFGGTSVQTLDRMRHVARIVKRTLQHKKVIVVVSAMAGETDRLLELGANFIVNSSNMCARELDSLVSTGEQVSASLLSLALQEIGVPAKSFLSHQVKIVTSDEFNSARIQQIEFKNLLECLNNGIVPVVAGFQGIDQEGNITTLGRGGSDTTAVALAGALKAIFPEVTCEIFTDV